jgi:hypothetical protein
MTKTTIALLIFFTLLAFGFGALAIMVNIHFCYLMAGSFAVNWFILDFVEKSGKAPNGTKNS